jgi:hypothetical protein
MRRSRSRFLELAAAVSLGLLTACGGSSRPAVTQTTRPTTHATLTIVSPSANEVTGSSIVLKFAVQGATVSPPNKLLLVPNEGHIHVSLDGKLVQMAYSVSAKITGLAPGVHTVQAQFVANDHLPFADPVAATVLFTVK